MSTLDSPNTGTQKVGGWAALYLAMALLAAMPYFLLVVDYPSATTIADKVVLVIEHYSSMYAMYLATYVAFGIAVGTVALSLHDRLSVGSPFAARLATGAGLLWSVALIASGMIYTFGMTTIVGLAKTDPEQARLAWQAMEPVALALGGAGGELLGGLWALLTSLIALRSGVFARPLGLLGVAIGTVGLASVAPPLHDAAMLFGLLEIVWFTWLGILLIRPKGVLATERLEPARAL